VNEVTLESALRLITSEDVDSSVPANYVRAARTLAVEMRRRLAEDIAPVMPYTGRDEILLVTSRNATYPLTSDTMPAFDTMTDRDIAVARSLLALAQDRMDRMELPK
jgi:hypothetical protein